MTLLQKKRDSLVLYLGATKAFIMGLMLLLSGENLYTSAYSPFYTYLPSYHLVGYSFIIASLLGLYGVAKDKVVFILPLLSFIILSAFFAFTIALQGHYADGVPRSFYFIFTDQLPAMVLALFFIYSLSSFNKYHVN